jgi:hypothetical protein
MIPRSASPASFDALPNPRGGSVRSAELALAEAQLALEQRGDAAAALLRAAQAFREAGWLGAQKLADALVLVSPLTAAEPPEEPDARQLFTEALHDFRAATTRHNLRELSCSPILYGHYQALSALISQRTPGFTVTYEDFALAARPLPPVSFSAQPAERLAHLRARYERALLPVLRAHSSDGVVSAADFWRLASACARSLRVSGHLVGDADARRFHARCNLALADHARGSTLASRSLVRATLALLWRDYALFGAAAEDAEHVELLHDYGLTVDWHVAATQESEALWEAGATEAQELGAGGLGVTRTRELGVLTVNAHAYEDFLQTADAAIAALAEHARGAGQLEKADPSEALQAGDAAYRLGAAACALGLGHVALLADALGLAWRRRAHAGVSTPGVRAHVIVSAPDAQALEQGAEALRAMLHKIAAGGAPAAAGPALAALTRAIEQG